MKFEILDKSDNKEVQNKIITQIAELINLKNLEPGDKLPSERMLSEKLEVTRSAVRDAINKLEFYGLLKSIPQSGTFVANIGVTAMNGIVNDILRLEDPDFKQLVETRIFLELKIVKLAALRRTDEDLLNIKKASEAFEEKVLNNENAVQEDLLFHLAIANACGNSTLNAFMLKITPEIITNFKKYHVCGDDLAAMAIKEHKSVLEAIESRDTTKAREMMKIHFRTLYQFCYNVE
ncbi:FadR/GntR family transcriptional regulator [Formosa sp. PL04]|uniref:FadR/GntR family transcriptional regulator n=1 Tax=Formosa sp. PL04 TaxID=3081755 RepID=UPI002981A850|nr:FadR/GntR family transcriptional regulator [Formosa sp. PL04]MDW5290391.1 FadR/GntR family transcriptional regulator [Formosa sp. PL04]